MTFSINFSQMAKSMPEDSKEVEKIIDDCVLSNTGEIPSNLEGGTKNLFLSLFKCKQFEEFTDHFIKEPIEKIMAGKMGNIPNVSGVNPIKKDYSIVTIALISLIIKDKSLSREFVRKAIDAFKKKSAIAIPIGMNLGMSGGNQEVTLKIIDSL